MRRLAFALLVLGCDAGDEGREPVTPPGLGWVTTTGGEAGSSTGEETTTTTTGAATSSTTSTSTSSSTSTTTLAPTTGPGEESTSTSTTGDPTTSSTGGISTTGDDSTSTGEQTTTGGEVICPCTAEVMAGQNVCAQPSTPTCPATLPGGLCDPDGDGSYADGDWNAGYWAYLDACA